MTASNPAARADVASPVLFLEIAAASGHRIGHARLARARQRNALNRDMCTSMLEQLRAWASDESIACVVIDGDGDKAMCAGGDVVTVTKHIKAGGASRYAYGDALFGDEYRLVRLIHEYPKPVISWAHGVTMGAGMGLAVAASHRIVSPGVMLAMPEIQIALFPDVGAGWFLNRAPAGVGLLVAMTGLVLGEADARFAGFADWSLPLEQRDTALDRLTRIQWTGISRDDRAAIDRMLDKLALLPNTPFNPSPVQQRSETLRSLSRAPDPATLADALMREAAIDHWFGPLADNLSASSPFAAAVTFEHLRRSRMLSLSSTLDQDDILIKALIRRDDFVEGVRALLLDKDRSPAWSPARFGDVSAEAVHACFRPPRH